MAKEKKPFLKDPKVPLTHKIAYGILCARFVTRSLKPTDKQWNTWAHKWLAGINRDGESSKARHSCQAAISAAADFSKSPGNRSRGKALLLTRDSLRSTRELAAKRGVEVDYAEMKEQAKAIWIGK